jgi:predicted DCC family thiol-disulfide oxidoreductase YuxK
VTAGATAAAVAVDPGAAAGGAPDRLVVMFDRDCGLCQATARRLRQWDRHGRLELLSLQDALSSDRPLVAATARNRPVLAELHVLDERTGRVDAGGDAALAIAAVLPGGRLVGRFRRVAPVRWIVGAGYALVARNRHRIGRRLRLEGPACDVPR